MARMGRASAAAWRVGIILCNVVLVTPSPAADSYGDAMPPEAGGLARYVCETIHPNVSRHGFRRCTSQIMKSSLLEGFSSNATTGRLAVCRGADSITLLPARPAPGEAYQLALLLHDEPTQSIRDMRLERAGELVTFEGLAAARYRVLAAPLDRAGRRTGAWRTTFSAPRTRPLPVRHFRAPAHYNYTAADDNCDYTAWYVCDGAQPADYPVYVQAGDSLEMVAHKLRFDGSCQFHVNSSLGAAASTAHFNFTTPPCAATLSADLCPPERPRGVTTLATETTWPLRRAPLYSVLVRWAAPAHAPHNYTVHLADLAGNHSARLLVDGSAREARFVDAPLSGRYHVMVTAWSRAGHTSSELIVGNATAREWRWAREVGWAAACVGAALALGAVLWLLRRSSRQQRARRHLYFEDLEKKAPKEASVESGLLQPGDAFELRPDSVVLFEVLGEGAFGVVRKGWHADLGKEVAVKMLKDVPALEDVRAFRQEMEVMKSVGAHPHVVSLLGCVASARRMMIVVEYCALGDLLHYLRCAWDVMASKRNQKLHDRDSPPPGKLLPPAPTPERGAADKLTISYANKLYDVQGVCETELTAVDLLSFCRQIARGMEFLASNRVVHRDLAARNVLVCSDRTVKIADFGLSRDVYEDNQYKKTGSGRLPLKWMALESLTHQIYTTQSDVWSFGVLLWEAVTLGGAPYPGVAVEQLPRLLRTGYRMARPLNCANEIYELMLMCWRTRPKDRPTFTELHQKLDELLNGMCHKEYLSLDILDLHDVEGSQKVPPDKVAKYWGLISRDKRSGSGSHATGRLTLYQKYVRPLYTWRSQSRNLYSLTPTQASPPALF